MVKSKLSPTALFAIIKGLRSCEIRKSFKPLASRKAVKLNNKPLRLLVKCLISRSFCPKLLELKGTNNCLNILYSRRVS